MRGSNERSAGFGGPHSPDRQEGVTTWPKLSLVWKISSLAVGPLYALGVMANNHTKALTLPVIARQGQDRG
jgi:hypothetical protein